MAGFVCMGLLVLKLHNARTERKNKKVNHDHLSATSGFPLTEMEIMWILMVVMFAWNFVMAYQHHRLKKKTDCSCGRVDDDNTAKAKRNEAV